MLTYWLAPVWTPDSPDDVDHNIVPVGHTFIHGSYKLNIEITLTGGHERLFLIFFEQSEFYSSPLELLGAVFSKNKAISLVFKYFDYLNPLVCCENYFSVHIFIL